MIALTIGDGSSLSLSNGAAEVGFVEILFLSLLQHGLSGKKMDAHQMIALNVVTVAKNHAETHTDTHTQTKIDAQTYTHTHAHTRTHTHTYT